jgi:hypothetical protein
MSTGLVVALCLIGLLGFGIFAARGGGHFRFRAEALGIRAEGEIETKDPAQRLPSAIRQSTD